MLHLIFDHTKITTRCIVGIIRLSTKQRVNRCTEHKDMGLLPSGPCGCYITYVYPKNKAEDGRRDGLWF